MSTRSTGLPANVFTADQLLLLRTVIAPTPDTMATFVAWAEQIPVERLDRGSRRMVPLLDHLLDADHPWRATADADRQRNLAGDQRRRRTTAAMASVLRTVGIEPLVFKGVALVAAGVLDAELRAMADIDAAVRIDQFVLAQDTLIAAGWTIDHRVDPTRPAGSKHALTATGPDGDTVDLHWNVLHHRSESANRMIWNGSQELTIDGVTVRVPATHDNLLIACVHRFGWKRVPPLQWVVDATAIIAEADEAFWRSFVDHVDTQHLSLPVCDALALLVDFGVTVPGWVVPHLSSRPRPRWTNLEFRLATAPADPRLRLSREFRLLWLTHRTRHETSLARSLVAFPRFLASRQRRLPLHRLVWTWLRRQSPDEALGRQPRRG